MQTAFQPLCFWLEFALDQPKGAGSQWKSVKGPSLQPPAVDYLEEALESSVAAHTHTQEVKAMEILSLSSFFTFISYRGSALPGQWLNFELNKKQFISHLPH